MFTKLRRLLSLLLRPLTVALAALRNRSPLAWSLVLLGMLVCVVTLASVTGSGSSGSVTNAQNPRVPAKRAPVDTFSYSELRDAIQAREVKSASLKPAQYKVEVFLK
jgi:hypothetical protein